MARVGRRTDGRAGESGRGGGLPLWALQCRAFCSMLHMQMHLLRQAYTGLSGMRGTARLHACLRGRTAKCDCVRPLPAQGLNIPLTNWKNNPNEVKTQRKNRRR